MQKQLSINPKQDKIQSSPEFHPLSKKPTIDLDKIIESEEKKDDEPEYRQINRVDIESFELDEGTKVINGELRLYEKIGYGGFCKVYKALVTYIDEDDGEIVNKEMAVKNFNKHTLHKTYTRFDKNGQIENASQLDKIYEEIDVWERLEHEKLCRIFCLYEDDDQMYLVMQYCEHGTILNYQEDKQNPNNKNFVRNKKVHELAREQVDLKYLGIYKYSEEEEIAKYLFRQVAIALQYLHNDAKVAHRDIKPENILYIYEDLVKVSDFTLAMRIESEDECVYGQEGTIYYLPPESLAYEKYKPKPMDIWAFGVSLYNYLTLKQPFFGELEEEIKNRILNEEPQYFDWFSDDLKDLLKKVLEKDPNKRLDINGVLDHIWMQNEPEEEFEEEAEA
ncbi:protein kinase domain containing protein [Stylonychia lemnae]|uniref:Protein kinase domain containing protein n=1 Tax=Stylonychia lemnae TaxID=5949 RepID=A0A078A8R4_STYLE|nr:protein kinase domain containing protein [Stylonychia lemnae]|eukprot:CDW78665.1 protein kinase domain containing protein [Stylonychia lemnae]